jgi:hypothetical protein
VTFHRNEDLSSNVLEILSSGQSIDFRRAKGNQKLDHLLEQNKLDLALETPTLAKHDSRVDDPKQ